jgi:hypothetical protein
VKKGEDSEVDTLAEMVVGMRPIRWRYQSFQVLPTGSKLKCGHQSPTLGAHAHAHAHAHPYPWVLGGHGCDIMFMGGHGWAWVG